MPSDAERTIERLKDIIESIDAALSFTAGKSVEDFAADIKTQYATIRALEIVSEASRHIPDEIKVRYPHIPWVSIKAAGNVFRHGYRSVLIDLVWETVRRDLEPLSISMRIELKRLVGT